ncbi:MAG TPA: response regulator [bacterium]|nr:response regulator [bacterium]
MEQDGRRILIIEDNVAFCKMLKIRLDSRGYRTQAATNGLEGLAAVRQFNPELVVTDILLPGLDGHKLCRMIKFDRNFKHIPVIVLTSRDLDADEEQAKRCGADAFIIKTTRAEIVIDVIEKLLAKTK